MDDKDLPEPEPDKYWITDLNQSSVKSQYAVRFTLVNQPENEEEIKKWLLNTLGYGKFIYKLNQGEYYYSEVFFRDKFDSTMFVLQWGKSFT